MNKLYLLGALALSHVTAYMEFGPATAATYGTPPFGTNTYTATDDCYSGGTATTLGMNNIYY